MILSLTTANNGIWVGTTNGAYWLQPDTGQQQIIRGDRLANPMVRDILRDRDGNIWFATHGGSVACARMSCNTSAVIRDYRAIPSMPWSRTRAATSGSAVIQGSATLPSTRKRC